LSELPNAHPYAALGSDMTIYTMVDAFQFSDVLSVFYGFNCALELFEALLFFS
jgi:hypothetical protein